MSSQPIGFFRPWSASDNEGKKGEEPRKEEACPRPERKPKAQVEEDFDCESDDSLAGSSSSYNSIDSERSLEPRRQASKAPLAPAPARQHEALAAAVGPSAYGLPKLLHPGFSVQPIWDQFNVRLDDAAVYYSGIAAEVDRINQQEFVAKQIKKTRPKNFSCSYCPAAFSNNGQLKGHLRTHTGEKPYRCNADGCCRAFTRNEELTRHKRIHSGLKPFVCDICQKKFGRKDHLKKHFKTHNRYSNAAEYDFACMATLLSGHYYGYYPPTAAVPAAAFNMV